MNLNKITSSPSHSSDPSPAGGSASKNVLASDVHIKGTITFDNELICDGKVEGEIISDGILVIGKNAEVKGEVMTKSVTVHGTVIGNITVAEKAELKASARLTGDLTAARIVVEEGATFVGKSEVTPNKNSKPATPAPSSSPNSGGSPSGNQPSGGSSSSSPAPQKEAAKA